MKKLIILPTAVAEWHALVNEAENTTAIKLNEELECYLVFLLLRFSNNPQLVASVIALEFLYALKILDRHSRENLQNIGDKCLLFSGLFPGMAERRNVRISYFVSMGRAAYEMLANEKQSGLAKLYEALYTQFIPLMEVLQTIRELAESTAGLTPLQAQELWSDTGSRHAFDVLKRCTSGLVIQHELSKEKH